MYLISIACFGVIIFFIAIGHIPPFKYDRDWVDIKNGCQAVRNLSVRGYRYIFNHMPFVRVLEQSGRTIIGVWYGALLLPGYLRLRIRPDIKVDLIDRRNAINGTRQTRIRCSGRTRADTQCQREKVMPQGSEYRCADHSD
jgi:hypothetical protein